MAMFFSETGHPLTLDISKENPVTRDIRNRAQTAIYGNTFFLMADGHELAYIIGKFNNLTYPDTLVVTWRGEMARFIIENLFT